MKVILLVRFVGVRRRFFEISTSKPSEQQSIMVNIQAPRVAGKWWSGEAGAGEWRV